ncbi:MAG: TonB-dependent receptor, partial [Acidobacteria bacterium]
MSNNTRRRLALLLAVLVTSAASLQAQSSTGRISGTVVDSSGAVLPGATVTVTQDQTGLAKNTVTDKDGAYLFVSLPVGTYSVSAEMQGFRKQLKSGFHLVADGRVTADFTLPVGQMSEVVEVTVAAETVNTTSGEISRVVDREQVQNLALNGRQYLQLASLIPGSPLLDGNLNALDIMTGLGINTSINGSRTNTSLLTVDGGFNMDSGSNNSQI